MKNIGILGGGQLGKMSCEAAQKLGFRVIIFSDIKDCPGSLVADELIVASYLDEQALQDFAKKCDVVTCEFENIPFSCVDYLAKFVDLCPKAEFLALAQNRILEKNFINDCDVKTAKFRVIKSKEDIISGLNEFGKAILKTASLGYDGKGQYVLNKGDDLDQIWLENKDCELILEEFCQFKLEISVLVARKNNGDVVTYEPTRNIHKNGILDESHFPANISQDTILKSQALAQKLAQKMQLVGILCVELFILENDEILVNEIALRPHNSGHFSMDAAPTSQFEQLIRAITDLELGEAKYFTTGYMKNLIGDDVNNLADYENNENCKIHLYGKTQAREGRKMGHVNILN